MRSGPWETFTSIRALGISTAPRFLLYGWTRQRSLLVLTGGPAPSAPRRVSIRLLSITQTASMYLLITGHPGLQTSSRPRRICCMWRFPPRGNTCTRQEPTPISISTRVRIMGLPGDRWATAIRPVRSSGPGSRAQKTGRVISLGAPTAMVSTEERAIRSGPLRLAN